MRFSKTLSEGYIVSIGIGGISGEEIPESEYNEIMAVIQSKPAVTETTDYRLRENLTWEEFEVEPPEPDSEIDDSEVLDILLGGTL